MNKNYTHNVIQRSEVTKNLGNTRLMYPRSFTPFRMTMLAAAMALSFSACQNEEPLDAPVAKDALALMPAETPVGIQAQLKGGFAQGESRTGTSTTATNWYAWCEIHPTNQLVGIELTVPGASDPDKTSLSANDVSLESLQTTEPFSTLKLKDFNLTEGGDRCVSRWTELSASCFSSDHLIGFARLEADAQGNPVLDFGELKRTVTKVTLVLQDENGDPIRLDDGSKVSAEISYQQSYIASIYTPEGETQAIGFSDYLKGIKTLQADEAIDPERFGWAVYAAGRNFTFPLEAMVNADESASYYGEQDNMRALLVRPTPTHKKNDDGTFTLLEGGPQLTDADKLTIQVMEDPDGANGPLTTGKYTLKLKDVKVVENGEQKSLTALKSGEHLTLTVTLAHNMKVSATATIGGWDEVSADVDLNQDPSKLPPYEYDATTKTYTVYEEPYVKTVWDMKAADDKVMYDGMLVVDGSASSDAIFSVITGAIDDGITGFYVINISNEDKGQKLGAAIYYLVDVDEGGDPKNPNNPYIGTLSIVLADAEAIDALYYCAALKSVSAPKVKSVGDWAFGSSKFLTKVTLDAATTIGEMAFFDCTELIELTFGGVITEIGEMAFATYGSSNTPWTLNCDLTLANGQKHMLEITPTNPISYPDVYPVTPADEDAEENRRIWADYIWKSITIK